MRILTLVALFAISACDSGEIGGNQSSDAALSDATLSDDSQTGGAGDGGIDADANIADGTNPSNGSGGDFPGAKVRSAPLSGGGTINYNLYIPGSYSPGTAIPIVTLFHGQGGSAENIVSFWTSVAEAEGFMLLATTATGSSGGWVPGSDISRYSDALDDALAAYNVEQDRIYIWGFSAGAHIVHGVALTNTDTFAAYSVSAGVLDAFAGGNAPAASARRIPVDIHIGTADSLFAGAMSDRGRFTTAGWVEGADFSWSPFDGGHTLLPSHPSEIWNFIKAHRLP